MASIIRKGTPQDAAPAIRVLRRSIQELCVADHRGDADEIAQWLANKTESAWADWIARRDATVLVAEDSGRITSVGMIDHSGEVLLNYVSPAARFCGTSKAMLGALESAAGPHGAAKCTAESTETAKQFYISAGYSADMPNSLFLEKVLTKNPDAT